MRFKTVLAILTMSSVLLLIGCKGAQSEPANTGNTNADKESDVSTVHELEVNDIDGNSVSLAEYEGKVLLFVNVASQCGYTGQYAGLQELSEAYADEDFLVLGFPSNDFGGQEPGSNKEIKFFCKENYDVTFPMFAKIPVKGDGAHPLYQYLTTSGDVSWNFNKYLVGKDGKIIQHFESNVKPGSDELKTAINAALEG